MIDSLEQNEEDPGRLSNLFAMDHLVTRMRRNSENLLLLAGHEGARKWSEPVPLTDVARAAISEIEQYNRVALRIQPGVMVAGHAVSDVVHLLAELIENATVFSASDTQVLVSVQELASGGVLIQVSDSGVGVSDTRLAEMNRRLDDPPPIDESVSRHMGLYAVARLAERHGVRVRLRAGNPQGLTALVWLPDSVAERNGRQYGDVPQRVVTFEARRPPGQHAAGQPGPRRPHGGRDARARAAREPRSRIRGRRPASGQRAARRIPGAGLVRAAAAIRGDGSQPPERVPARRPPGRGSGLPRRDENGPLSYAYHRDLDWLVTDFTRRVPDVAHAVVVSADGVLLARSQDLPHAFAEQFALITCGLASLMQGAARIFEAGAPTQGLVEMAGGLMLVKVISDGSSLAVLAALECDTDLVSYEVTLLVEAVGEALTPAARAHQGY